MHHYKSNMQRRLVIVSIVPIIIGVYVLFVDPLIHASVIKLIITVTLFLSLLLLVVSHSLNKSVIKEIWLHEEYIELRMAFSVVTLEFIALKITHSKWLVPKIKLKTSHKTYTISAIDFPQFKQLHQQLSKYYT